MAITTGEATRSDFRTDVTPSLFMDNWGVDVIAEHADKVQRPIEAAVALAQLLASLRGGQPIDHESLDCNVLDGVLFVDGSNGESDHFFRIDLAPRYEMGSYAGPRVSATYKTGYIKLDENISGGTYDERWSTRRADVIWGRSSDMFTQDTARITNAITNLEAGLVTTRPETWPGVVADQTITSRMPGEAIYVGTLPLNDVAPEPRRPIHIPFLDD